MRCICPKLAEDYFDKIDFGDGIRQKDDDKNGILSMRWHGGVYLKIRENKFAETYEVQNGAYIIYGYK